MKSNPCWYIGLCLLIWLSVDTLGQNLPSVTLPELVCTILAYDIEQKITPLVQAQEAQEATVTTAVTTTDIVGSSILPDMPPIWNDGPGRRVGLQLTPPDPHIDRVKAFFFDLP
jgi:hypothetical protein